MKKYLFLISLLMSCTAAANPVSISEFGLKTERAYDFCSDVNENKYPLGSTVLVQHNSGKYVISCSSNNNEVLWVINKVKIDIREFPSSTPSPQ